MDSIFIWPVNISDSHLRDDCHLELFNLDFPGIIAQFQTAQRIIHTGDVTPHPSCRCSTIRTNIPRQFHETVAVLTVLLELCMTVRADLPVIFDATLTTGAERQIFQRLKQGFLFERALILFLESPLWAQDEI